MYVTDFTDFVQENLKKEENFLKNAYARTGRVKVKIKQSRYRPGVTQRVPGI